MKIRKLSGIVFGFFGGSERSRGFGILDEPDFLDDTDRLSTEREGLRSLGSALLLLEVSSVDVPGAESCATPPEPDFREGSSDDLLLFLLLSVSLGFSLAVSGLLSGGSCEPGSGRGPPCGSPLSEEPCAPFVALRNSSLHMMQHVVLSNGLTNDVCSRQFLQKLRRHLEHAKVSESCWLSASLMQYSDEHV